MPSLIVKARESEHGDASDEHDDASEHASSEPEVVEDTVPVSRY